MIVVLSETLTHKSSVNARETQAITEAARLFGCRVYTIPPNFDECETAENALAYVPEFSPTVPGVWVGVIPTYERYQAIYDAAIKKGVRLVNSPEQHRSAMEFDRFYPMLGDMTPKSVMLDDLNQLTRVRDELVFPVFVKGAVKSDKDMGWNAVVAQDLTELSALAQRVLANPGRARGKVIVRELAKLKHIATDLNGFPIRREYRAFLYQGKLLAYGFYWEGYNDPTPLGVADAHEVIATAREAARRVNVPFISVDLGQLEDGRWIVIEIGDGQFSGLSQITVLELWSKIKDFTL